MGFLSGPTSQRSTSESSSTFQSAVIRNSAFGLTPSTFAFVGATATITTERMHSRRSARPTHIGERSTFIYKPVSEKELRAVAAGPRGAAAPAWLLWL